MIVDALIMLAGLVLLVAGGEALVRGAVGLAARAGWNPAVIGLVVVATGTSMPELVVTLRASFAGNTGVAMGNIVGSNIFNIGVVLGLTALIRPLTVHGNSVRLEYPVMLLAALQLHLLARDGSVDRLEGVFLCAGLAAFTTYAIWIARRHVTVEERGEFAANLPVAAQLHPSWLRSGLFVVVGVGLLSVGAVVLVSGAASLARDLGVSDTVIGLTIVAMGTSTPELATSVVAAIRGNSDIAVANVLGSNIFNALGIGGVTAIVHPLGVPDEVVARDNWWMIGATLLLLPLMRTGQRINRVEGAVLVGGYATYTVLLLAAA